MVGLIAIPLGLPVGIPGHVVTKPPGDVGPIGVAAYLDFPVAVTVSSLHIRLDPRWSPLVPSGS
ncbi:MAG TPA: hypothetical protein VGI68_11470 [Mycobacterium sp.]